MKPHTLTRSFFPAALLAVSAALLAACSSHGPPAAGELLTAWPTNVSSRVDGGGTWTAAKVSWGNYNSFVVAPVLVDDNEANLGPDDVQTLTSSLTSALSISFGAGRTAAAARGPGTLVVTAEIVQAIPNQPLRNVVPLSQIRRAGYGTVTVDIQVTDGGTGALLLAFRGTEETKRVSAEKLSVWGSAEESFSKWAAAVAGDCSGQ